MFQQEVAIEKCQKVFGFSPKTEQLQVIEAVHDGKDCVLIAPTGWGKTLVFTLPLVLWPDAVILVITPLKALGEEQTKKLNGFKIKSINITEDSTITAKEILEGDYRAIFVSPEMLLESERLSGVWLNHGWIESVHAIVIDEAHCIDSWGKKFRRAFGNIAKLRLKMLGPTSFLAVSATLPPAVLQRTTKSLQMDDYELISVGNDRPNIRLSAEFLKSPMTSFKDLKFLEDKIKTMVYFNSREMAESAGDKLRSWFGNQFAEVYHAFKTDDLKRKRMDDFQAGKFPVLLATEAAGMGCDLRDVLRVVQFDYPADLNCLVQRIGRAARDPRAQGAGILLVPGSRSASDPDIEKFVSEPTCRREFLNNYYHNKPATVDKDLCCDLCSPDATCDLPPAVKTKRKPGERRTDDQKSQVRNKLAAWRSEAFLEHFEGNIHDTEETVMTDSMLERLVGKHANIASLGSLEDVIGWNPVKNAFKGQVESILIDLNDQFNLEKQEILDARERRRRSKMPFTEAEYMSYFNSYQETADGQSQAQIELTIGNQALDEAEDVSYLEPSKETVPPASVAPELVTGTTSEPVSSLPSPTREVSPTSVTTPVADSVFGNDLKFIEFTPEQTPKQTPKPTPKPTRKDSKSRQSQKPRTQRSINDFFRLDL
jgi:superfamily II DNA helicase RecQ